MSAHAMSASVSQLHNNEKERNENKSTDSTAVMSAHDVSASVSQLHVNPRVENYLEEKSVQMPTPEECRQYFTVDSIDDVFQDLTKHGFSVVQDFIKLPDTNSGILKPMTEEAIFEYFNIIPTPEGCTPATNTGSGKRVQTKKRYSPKILAWGDIKDQLDDLFSHVWPHSALKYQATRLSSKGNAPPQAVHCDNATEGTYSRHTKFPVDVMIPISHDHDTFLDIRPSGTNKNIRILLRRGDLLVFRGDVAHRGVENRSKTTHYRIHVYVDHVIRRRTRRDPLKEDEIAVPRIPNKTWYVHVGFSDFKL